MIVTSLGSRFCPWSTLRPPHDAIEGNAAGYTPVENIGPINEPAKIPHHTTESPDSRSTASPIRFAAGTVSKRSNSEEWAEHSEDLIKLVVMKPMSRRCYGHQFWLSEMRKCTRRFQIWKETLVPAQQ